MIKASEYSIFFDFPEISNKHRCELNLINYLNWPIGKKSRRDGLSIVSARDFKATTPVKWQKPNSYICTAYQSEYIELSFTHSFTIAFKVAIDGINCTTGDLMQKGLNKTKLCGKDTQDYFLTYYDNSISQSAMKYVEAETNQEGIKHSPIIAPSSDKFTKEVELAKNSVTTEHHILIEAYPLKLEKTIETYKAIYDDYQALDKNKADSLVSSRSVIPNPDPFSIDDWDLDAMSSCHIQLINFETHLEKLGFLPEIETPTEEEMGEANQLWYEETHAKELSLYKSKKAQGMRTGPPESARLRLAEEG